MAEEAAKIRKDVKVTEEAVKVDAEVKVTEVIEDVKKVPEPEKPVSCLTNHKMEDQLLTMSTGNYSHNELVLQSRKFTK